jgi:exodeoxyribonuclease VII large subunit
VRFRGSIRHGEPLAQPGEIVVARGRIDLYPSRSRYQLVASAIERPGALGIFSLELEALKQRLAAEGIFDASRKRRLPEAPHSIGIVTSRSGSVIHDVIRVLRHRAVDTRLIVAHAAVQGANAPVELAEGIARLNTSGDVDVIIVARGGGSAEDLSAFNSEVVIRAIAASRTPVISAIGHESDVTLSDLVADVRAGTPSIAADLVAPPEGILQLGMEHLFARVVRRIDALLGHRYEELLSLAQRTDEAGPRELLLRHGEHLAQLGSALARSTSLYLQRMDGALTEAGRLLEALSPLRTLARGYAIALGPGGHPIRSWREAQVGGHVRVRLAAGAFRATITSTEKEGEHGRKA